MIDCENYNNKRGIYSPLIEHNGCVCGYLAGVKGAEREDPGL